MKPKGKQTEGGKWRDLRADLSPMASERPTSNAQHRTTNVETRSSRCPTTSFFRARRREGAKEKTAESKSRPALLLPLFGIGRATRLAEPTCTPQGQGVLAKDRCRRWEQSALIPPPGGPPAGHVVPPCRTPVYVAPLHCEPRRPTLFAAALTNDLINFSSGGAEPAGRGCR